MLHAKTYSSSHLSIGQLGDVVGVDGAAPFERDGGQRPDLAQAGPGSEGSEHDTA